MTSSTNLKPDQFCHFSPDNQVRACTTTPERCPYRNNSPHFTYGEFAELLESGLDRNTAYTPATVVEKRVLPELGLAEQIEIKLTLQRHFTHLLEQNPEFVPLEKIKEEGHGIARAVDLEAQAALQAAGYPIKTEVNSQGLEVERSFGDVWIEESSTINPINIKGGIRREGEVYGSGNLVSMKRLMASLTSGEITSYYVAIVKFDIKDTKVTPNVYFVDILNFVDHLAYNMGTGQIMMKEQELYDTLQKDPGRQLTRQQKIRKLRKLYNEGLEAQKRKLLEAEQKVKDYEKFERELRTHNCGKGDFPNCLCEVGLTYQQGQRRRSFK